jgi:hypothetical protein
MSAVLAKPARPFRANSRVARFSSGSRNAYGWGDRPPGAEAQLSPVSVELPQTLFFQSFGVKAKVVGTGKRLSRLPPTVGVGEVDHQPNQHPPE